MNKLYEIPNKNHLINVRCVWRDKSNNEISSETAANVKISVVFDPTSKCSFQIYTKEANLIRDTEVIGKMDPYLVIKIGEVLSKTNTLDNAGKNPKWN